MRSRPRGLFALPALGVVAALSIVLGTPACASQPPDDVALARAATALHTGKYEDAIAAYSALASREATAVAATRGLMRALAEVGRYDDAEQAAARLPKRGEGGATDPASTAAIANTLGEILLARGRVSEAEAQFRHARQGRAPDSLSARLNLALIQLRRGEHAAAFGELDGFIDVYNERRDRLTSAELMAVGTAVRHLGATDPQLFKDALRAFDRAIASDSMNMEARLRLAELFLEKYNGPEAAATLDALLRINPSHPRALVASARRARFAGEPGAEELARKSLTINPNLVEARVFLAAANIEREDYAGAEAEARRALAVDSTASEALSMLAASHYLRGDDAAFEAVRRRVLAHNTRDAGFFAALAEIAARNRLYADATRFAREAVRLDSTSAHALGVLGMNQLRVGEVAEGRRNLERAFARDPYHVWIKNTLDLLDTFAKYRETRTARFQLLIDPSESDLLGPYLGELLEEAYDKLVARYGYRPPTPVRMEVYRSHADFSVRTVGLAGLGALGVSFGTVLAMDSPAAREVGAFNWGSTAWHELAHTFTLGMTNHRVPRWLSEGISVYEERRARPGWGADATLGFLAAYKAGRLHPVSTLNEGFVRPSYPEQVNFSYYQASLVCELIERDWGARALTALLNGYRDRLTTAEVLQRVLKIDSAELDRRFDAFMRERFAGPLAAIRPAVEPDAGGGATGTFTAQALLQRAERAPGDWAAQLAAGRALIAEGDSARAVPFLERAKQLFPQYAGPDNPYRHLAAIHVARGDRRRAAAELATLARLDENQYAANLQLAELLAAEGDTAGAAAALERAVYIHPYEISVHERLAALHRSRREFGRAVRERQAVVALDPVDRPGALYQLALAHRDAGDVASARRAVLRALESAPGYADAQTLLLSLSGGSAPADASRPE